MARRFDGTDDVLVCSSGGLTAIDGGPITIAFIVKATDVTNGSVINLRTSTGAMVAQINNDTGTYYFETSTGFRSGGAVAITDNWHLFAVTKANGSATGRSHKYLYDTNAWTHANLVGSALGDSAAAVGASGTVQFGRYMATSEYWNGDLAIAGVWDRELTDAQTEQLPFSLQAWLSLAPVGLWLFDQSATTQNVADLVAGANQTSLTGTAVSTVSVPVFTYGTEVLVPHSVPGGTGQATVVGTSAVGTGQDRSGTFAGTAIFVGETADGSGQAREGIETGAGTLLGVKAHGTGQADEAIFAGSGTLIGSTAIGSGRSAEGLVGSSGIFTGSVSRGSGTATNGVLAAGNDVYDDDYPAIVLGASTSSSGQARGGAAVGGVALIGATGFATAQSSSGQFGAGATFQGSAAAASGRATTGTTTGAATLTGSHADGSGQATAGAPAAGQALLGTTARGSGQARSGAVTAAATFSGSAAQASGQGNTGQFTAAVNFAGTTASSSGQGRGGIATGAAVATFVGMAAVGTGHARSGQFFGTVLFVGSAATGSGQGREGLGVTVGTFIGSRAVGSGRAFSGVFSGPGTFLGFGAVGTGRAKDGLFIVPALFPGQRGQGSGRALTGRPSSSVTDFALSMRLINEQPYAMTVEPTYSMAAIPRTDLEMTVST